MEEIETSKERSSKKSRNLKKSKFLKQKDKLTCKSISNMPLPNKAVSVPKNPKFERNYLRKSFSSHNFTQTRFNNGNYSQFCYPDCASQAYSICQNSPYGMVRASVFDGTTFYHYYNSTLSAPPPSFNPEFALPYNGQENVISEDSKSFKQKNEIKRKCHEKPSFQTTCPHLSFTETNSHCSSFTSISSVSSRSSSPYLHSTRSSARDSGLVSTASTDDDISLDHSSTNPKKNLIELLKQSAEEIMYDEDLSKDSYLCRQMKRNPEGFVSIKLLGCTKKIKKLLSKEDSNLLIVALKTSDKLEVNKANTKVKRNSPLKHSSVSIKKKPSLLLLDPKNVNEIEDATKKLRIYGEISQVRIVKPERPLPLYLSGYSKNIPELGKVLCVTVEFEKESSLLAAYSRLSVDDDCKKVLILGKKIKKTTKSLSISQNTTPEEDNTKHSFLNESVLPKASVTRSDSGGSVQSGDSGIDPDSF